MSGKRVILNGTSNSTHNNNINMNNTNNKPSPNNDLHTSMEYAIHLYLTQAPGVFSEFEQYDIYSRFMRYLSTLKQSTWQKWISDVMNEKPMITMEDLIDVKSENIHPTRNAASTKIAQCLPLKPYQLSGEELGVELFDERPKHVKILLGEVFHSFIHFKNISFSDFEELDIIQLFLGCLFYCYDTYLRESQNMSTVNSMDHAEYLWLVRTYISQVVQIMKDISSEMQLICNHSLLLLLPDLKIQFTIYELQQRLRALSIADKHAVWQKLKKNSDGVIGDVQSLTLCVHIFISLALRKKNKQIKMPNTKTNDIYLQFLNKIKNYLVDNFAKREIRLQQNPNNVILVDCKSQSVLCVGFQDIVEYLPLWLYKIDQSIYYDDDMQSKIMNE